MNHFDEEGNAHMVDVSHKGLSKRCARAEAVIRLNPQILSRVLDREVAKGDVLGVARLAAIAAVKKTPDLIPLAHPLAIHHVSVKFHSHPKDGTISTICEVVAEERTGVEMEAMTGVSVAALTIYDMCKALDKGISIGPIRLLYKSGGKSGIYERPGGSE